MKKRIVLPWLTLRLVTMLSAIISANLFKVDYLMVLILVLAALKFGVVAYYFMDLKKAHAFWKTATILFLITFLLLVILLS